MIFNTSTLTASIAVPEKDLPRINIARNQLEQLRKKVAKGEEFQAALTAANESIKSEDRPIKEAALFLFEKLVQQGVGFKDAALSVKSPLSALKSTENLDTLDLLIAKRALNIIKALNEKKKSSLLDPSFSDSKVVRELINSRILDTGNYVPPYFDLCH